MTTNFVFGATNTATGDFSGAWGGDTNNASGDYSSVVGGQFNIASGEFAAVFGGNNNTAPDELSQVFGGSQNSALNTSQVFGGVANNIGVLGENEGFNVIVGGFGNSIGDESTFCGIYNSSGSAINDVSGGSTFCSIIGASSAQGGNGSSFCAIVGGTGGILGNASGYSVILGGANNTVDATGFGSVVMGVAAYGDADYAFIQAAGDSDTNENTPGRLQTYRLPINGETTNNITQFIYSLLIKLNTTIAFYLRITARRTDAASESALFEIRGIISNEAGTTALMAANTTTVVFRTNSAWTATATADNASGSLFINVTGETGKLIQWLVAAEFYKVSS